MKISTVIMFSIFLICFPLHSKASPTPSLDQDPIVSREGRRAFADQLYGDDGVSHLPPWITADELAKLAFNRPLLKTKSTNEKNNTEAEDTESQSLAIGKWPGRPDIYLAIGSPGAAGGDHAQIYTCAFKVKSPHNFEIIASLEGPRIYECGENNDITMSGGLDKLVDIDAAIFKISPSDCAVGLRLGHNEGYAGGIGYQENLLLLVQEGKTLRPVFNHMIYQMQWLAGDWNKDGSRQHSTKEKKFIAIVQNNSKSHFYPILIRQIKGGHFSKLYSWNKPKLQYQ